MTVASVLTAFNDNAAITYIATLVPGFSDALKYAVVGAVGRVAADHHRKRPQPGGHFPAEEVFPTTVFHQWGCSPPHDPTVIVFLLFLGTR